MKKIICLILIMIFSFTLISCLDIYKAEIITDIERYESIWQMSEHRLGEDSKLFPKVANKESIVDFMCVHQTEAYASVWNRIGCFEYAIIGEDRDSVTYIYLQMGADDDYKIEKKFFPKNYKITMEGNEFTIY